eukprot:Nk52_evm1s1632 gene=Nk52_evmTU1s1632
MRIKKRVIKSLAEDQIISGKAGESSRMGSASATVSEDEIDLQTFFEKIKQIRCDLGVTEGLIEAINSAHSELLVTVSLKQAKIKEKELEKLKTNLREQTRSVGTDLKFLASETKECEESLTATELRIRKMQHQQLLQKYTKSLVRFNEIEETYKQKYNERMSRQRKLFQVEADQAFTLSSCNDKEESPLVQQLSVLDSKKDRKMLLERQKQYAHELHKVEASLAELKDIFIDISLLVDQQSDLLDNIAYNVSMSSSYTESTLQELKAACALQSSARRFKIASATVGGLSAVSGLAVVGAKVFLL